MSGAFRFSFSSFAIVATIATFACTISAAAKCPLGTFKKGSSCEKCRPGTYQDEEGQSSCKKCEAGTYTPFSGVISKELCLRCPEGSNSKPGSSTCSTKCPKGHVPGCGKCLRCPPGQELTGCHCTPCGPDSFSVIWNSDKCFECPRGLRATANGRGCRDPKCPLGMEFRHGSCEKCEFNRFRNSSMTLCEPCPPRTSILEYFKPKVMCKKCPPGQFTSGVVETTPEQVTECLDCAQGTTTKGFGKVICRKIGAPCPSNFFEDADGDCEICDSDQRYDPIKKICVACKINEFSAGGLVTSCKPCPRGQIRSYGKCRCPAGKVYKNKKCIPCAAGTHRYESSDEYCIACSSDKFSEQGSEKCMPCPSGTTSSHTAGKKCEPMPKPKCPPGFIPPPRSTSFFPDDVCVSGTTGCPKGLEGVGFGVYSGKFLCKNKMGEVVCPKGTVFDNVDYCISCDAGYKLVKTKRGKLRCVECDLGSISSGGLVGKCKKCMRNYGSYKDTCFCPSDKFLAKNGSCRDCPKGTTLEYDPFVGTICARCQPGTSWWKGYCAWCPENTTSLGGTTKCMKCPRGTGTYGVGDATCIRL